MRKVIIISLILILLSSFGNALSETHGKTFNHQEPRTGCYGIRVALENDICITAIRYSTTTAGTDLQGRVVDRDENVLWDEDLNSSNYLDFGEAGYTLVEGQYGICAHDNSDNVHTEHSLENTMGLPIDSGKVVWYSRYYNNGGAGQIMGTANYTTHGTNVYEVYYTDGACPVEDEDTLNISSSSPSGLQTNISTININALVNSSFNFRCDLYINNSLEAQTIEITGQNNYNFSTTDTYTDGDYEYYISCYNATNPYEMMENTTLSYFYVDANAPSIDQNISGNYIDYVDFYINITDDNLQNITIQSECYYNYNNHSIITNEIFLNINLSTYDKGCGLGSQETNISICDSFGNCAEYTYYYNIILESNYLDITALNGWNQESLANAEFWINSTNTSFIGNPFQQNISFYVNETNDFTYTQVKIVDTSFLNKNLTTYINITRINTTMELELEPNQLILAFWDENVSANTNGILSTEGSENFIRNFNATPLVIVQHNMSIGYVNVKFGIQPDGTNWTQFYEYYNDHETNIYANIELLNEANVLSYYRVLDGLTPVAGAVVNIEFAQYDVTNNTYWRPHKLMGQRITDSDGYVYFYSDDFSELLITVEKEGYDDGLFKRTVGDENNDKENPIKLNIQRGTRDSPYFGINRIRSIVYNISEPMTGVFTSADVEVLKYTTNYRITQGLEPKSFKENYIGFRKYNYTLIPFEDYNPSSTDNITLYIWLNQELYSTEQITIDNHERVNLLEMPDFDDDILAPILLSFIIVFAGIISIIIKSDSIGEYVFWGGLVLTTTITSRFLVTIIFGVLYAVGLTIKRVMAE